MRLLLLAGTLESRSIAVALSRESNLSVTVSLPGPVCQPQAYGWPVRIGGWGGEENFRAFLEREQFDGIIDATHPFATGITHRASRLADALSIPYVQFLRPAWMPVEGDKWTFVNAEADAARHIPKGATVFLGTGRHKIEEFENLSERKIFCRVRESVDPPYPFANGRYLLQKGPFSVSEEVVTLRGLGIDWLVARNSGGQGSWPKIEAARELGIPVAMIRRPLQPEGLKITTVAEVLAWVRRRM